LDCQLENLPDAGNGLGATDRWRLRAASAAGGLVRKAKRILQDPRRLLVKVGLRRTPEPVGATAPIVPPPLHLVPGQRVRVKTLEQIRSTLDAVGDCEGLGFMPVQEAFCGREFVVRKRIERFFDERTRRMLRLRNTVILDGVFCEPPTTSAVDYAGCQRTCFLFWKEAWLEPV